MSTPYFQNSINPVLKESRKLSQQCLGHRDPDFSASLEMCVLFVEQELLSQLTLTKRTTSVYFKMRHTLYLNLVVKKNLLSITNSAHIYNIYNIYICTHTILYILKN